MDDNGQTLSDRVIAIVADVLDVYPLQLPPLEQTLSADALDNRFHRSDQPPGASVTFPYSDLWVVAHSSGAVDVFETFHAMTVGESISEPVHRSNGDARVVMVQAEDERYTFREDQLDALHQVVSDAETSSEAWEEIIEYARETAT